MFLLGTHITLCIVALPIKSQFKAGVSRKQWGNVMFCGNLQVTTKPFENVMFLKGPSAASHGNIVDSIGTLESLQNHCQQHLVALFTPMLHPSGRVGHPWIPSKDRGNGSAIIACKGRYGNGVGEPEPIR